MKLACQCLVLAYLVATLLYSLWVDFNGREPMKPQGFGGGVGTLVMVALLVAIMRGAGALSEVMP